MNFRNKICAISQQHKDNKHPHENIEID